MNWFDPNSKKGLMLMKEKALLFIAVISCSIYFATAYFQPKPQNRDFTTAPEASTEGLLPDEINNIKINKKAAPMVVNVSSIKVSRSYFGTVDEPSGGSGFVWDESGYIVTNFHVVSDARKIYVSLHKDNTQYPAEIVGWSPRNDIAVLKIKAPVDKLHAVEVGHSSNLMVGQKAIALGNPFGLDHTLTTGIISALNRKIDGAGGVEIHGIIQTDASINPGNSGGPLMDSRGRLIGMNTAIISKSGSSAGLGFAVPVQTIKRIVPQLIEHGQEIRPTMGIALEPRVNISRGIAIKQVMRNSPAAKAGLKGMLRDSWGRLYIGDVIIKLDEHNVNSLSDLYHALDKYKIGDSVTITFFRNNKKFTTKVKLGSNSK